MNLRPAVYFIIAAVIIIALGYFYRKSVSLKSNNTVNPVNSIDNNQGSVPPRFAGGRVCAECHKAEYELWLGSHHDLAMQEAAGDAVSATSTGQSSRTRMLNPLFIRKTKSLWYARTVRTGSSMTTKSNTHSVSIPYSNTLSSFPAAGCRR